MINQIKDKTLRNGEQFPAIGLGTYKITSKKIIEKSLKTAYDSGYHLIDTAEIYKNEKLIGNALKNLKINLDDVFLTSKVWDTNHGYNNTQKAYDRSCKNLRKDVLDLYLIHWPRGGDLLETWRALEDLYEDGKVRSIGVSNFTISHLKKLISNCRIPPFLNQVEFHPRLYQKELLNFCNSNKIVLESYCPLAKGKLVTEPIFNELAEKYRKSPAQIVLRWLIEHDLIIIPKSKTPHRIKANIDIFDFSLANEDLQTINELHPDLRINPDPEVIIFN